MMTCLIALYETAKKNLYWLILALAFALMFWLAPKVNATPLDDFLVEHHLDFPNVVIEQMKLQNLIAAGGMLNSKEQAFTVYFLKKPETEDVTEFDIHKAIMKVRFYLVKKWVIVEYKKEILWNANEYKTIIIHLELYPL